MNWFTLDFWFNLRPTLSASMNVYLGTLLVFAVIGIASFIIRKVNKASLFNPIWFRFTSFGIYNAIIAAIVWFFAYEMVPFLSARFWYIIWGAGIMVWLYFISREMVKIPSRKEELEKEKEYKKYIP